jgi:hypothetical protein
MTQNRNTWIATKRKILTKRTCLVSLIASVGVSAAAGGAFAQGASVAIQTNAPAPAPARTVKLVCCRVSLQLLVDGQLVSHKDMMVFDTKDRTVTVDGRVPTWNFRFGLTPSVDKQTLQWTTSVEVADRVVHRWAVTGAMKDPQTFNVTDKSTHKTFSAVARAMVLIAPGLKHGTASARPGH